MDFLTSFLTGEVQNALKDLVDLALLGLVGVAAETLRRKYGVEVSQKRQNDIHRALTTGAHALMAGKSPAELTEQAKEVVVLEVIDYAKQSVPDAIKKLGATDSVLKTLARSKLNMVLREIVPFGGGV